MIGVFDSGVGGLSSLLCLQELLPRADLVYYADEAHLPYGEKSADEICRLTEAACARLVREGATAILAACGTASSVALPYLKERFSVPIFGIAAPTAQAVAAVKTAGDILILATEASIRAGVFAREIANFANLRQKRASKTQARRRGTPTAYLHTARCTPRSTEVLRSCFFATHGCLHTLPCPDFVHMAESGRTDPSDPRNRAEAARILAPVLHHSIDKVVLGCTHFSLLSDLIAPFFPSALLIDAAREGARTMANTLPDCEKTGKGECRLITSGDTECFLQKAERILGISQHTGRH